MTSRRQPPPRRSGSRAWVIALVAILAVAGIAYGVRRSRQHAAPPPPPTPVNVTFPEGLRREQIAAILAAKTHLSAGAYLAQTGVSGQGQVLAGTKTPRSLEGFLFPATYQFLPTTTVGEFVNEQLAAYHTYTAGVDYAYAASKHLTPYDVLTIASIIEREVAVPSERALVAAVIYNRLHDGMTLGMDSTVQYAVGYWKPTLTAADLRINSPYNTLINHGLPPSPICNPGVASIEAAAHPAHVPYLYYVNRNDGTNGLYFATTYAQFNADVAKSDANLHRGG
jgi:UPF0755 protein